VDPLYGFVQFEFTHAIGPAAGRYVAANPNSLDEDGAAPRSDDVSRRQALAGATMIAGTADVLAVTIVGARAGRPKLRRRATPADAQIGGDDVPLLLATFIRGTEPLRDAAEGATMLKRVSGSEELQQSIVADGLRVLNQAISAYRAGARDPYVTEVAQRDARHVRIGYGTREQVAEGRWQEAIVLPPELSKKPSREERLVPAEVTAGVLSGRATVLEGETVLLRAYADLDHRRDRAAALQVRAAIHLLEVELAEREAIDVTRVDFEELASTADGLVARTSAPGGDQAAVEELEGLIEILERGVERWRFAGADA
jgi:hypothetical protein